MMCCLGPMNSLGRVRLGNERNCGKVVPWSFVNETGVENDKR